MTVRLQMRTGAPNDFQTPVLALTPLLSFIPMDWTIWECASGKGNLVRGLQELGYDVIGTDILGGRDFLAWRPAVFDCIITNPPYSIKQKFLERAYEIGKPFAFLLPLTTFETRKRQELFDRYGLEVIFFDKRINFETPSGNGSGSWFASAWFTNGLNIGKAFSFVKLEKQGLADVL